jgi:glycosyltransferase involved in cell wall biosynthesis
MSKKIKILFYISTLNAGGAERITVTMIKQLDREVFDIYLVLVKKVGAFLDDVPSYVEVIDLKKEKTLFSIFSLRKVLQDIQPNMVYSTLFRTHIAMDWALIGLGKEIKRIYRSPTSPRILFARGEMGYIMKKLITKAYRNADKILAQTPEMKKEICEYHSIPSPKIITFLNPIDTSMINARIKNSKNPFSNEFINIVAAGRLSDVKGFDVLLVAFEKVLKQNNKFSLHIIGRDAGEEKKLRALAEKLFIEKRVTFWGYQDNPFKFFFFSDLFVLSSRREGLPNAVLENIYIKKPIVATRCIPYMDSLIDDGKSGFLVEVEDSEALADSILNYKKLDVDKYNYMEKLIDVNMFFSNID